MFSTLFPTIVPFMRECGKIPNSLTGHRQYNMAHAHCMLDIKGCKQTLIICTYYHITTNALIISFII
jgi:hypothetical protein